jgi:exopolysaccharide biosynthesis WecB/TagA/CpsF family protein
MAESVAADEHDGAGNDTEPRRWFLGAPLTPLDLETAAQRIAARPLGAPFVFVSTPNAQHIVHVAARDRRFEEAHDRGWLVLNDSRILSILSEKLFGQTLPTAAGSDLTALMFRKYIHPEDSISIIGATAEVERLLRAQFGLQKVARFDPPMGFYNNPAEIERCVDFIVAHPARYVFIAVGAPQSEVVACQVLQRGGAIGTGLCIGSSLHFVTGVVKRAPAIFQRFYAEGFYRLWQNPRRHARRLFVESLPVLWIALKYRLTPRLRRSHERPSAR